jgi:hypothetical protein
MKRSPISAEEMVSRLRQLNSIQIPPEVLFDEPMASVKRRSVMGNRNKENTELSNPNNFIMEYESIF